MFFIPVYKDKNGKWFFRVYVINKDGKKIQRQKCSFLTKKDCIKAENDFLNSFKDKNDSILFLDLYNSFIKVKSQDLKFQSFRSEKNRFEKHILPFFKDYQIKNIKFTDYVDWKEKILKMNYSYTYMSSLHQAMTNILNYAMKYYDLEINVASKVGNFSKRNYVKKVNFWTYEEFEKFISCVDDIVYYTFFNLLYFTGMRRGEILALNWNDLQENFISINKNLIRSSNQDCKFNSPKTFSSIRKIEIDDFNLNNLKKLKDFYKSFVEFNDDWFIFGGICPLSTTTIERRKKMYCKKANIKQIKIHEFRHSHASLLLSKNVPISVISKRLGHSSINTTFKVYSHLIPEDSSKAIAILNSLKGNLRD